MNNIVFQRPDGICGVVHLAEDVNAVEYAQHLVDIGVLQADWSIVGCGLPADEVSKLTNRISVDDLRIKLDRQITIMIEDAAKSKGFDSMLSAASYVTSAVPAFKKDAKALVSWRDSVWDAWFALRSSEDADALAASLDKLPKFQ